MNILCIVVLLVDYICMGIRGLYVYCPDVCMLAFLILMSYGIIIATWCMMIGIVSFMCGSDGLQEDIVHRRQHLTYSDILELCRHPVKIGRASCRERV